MILLHKLLVFLNCFKRYPKVRRSAWIGKEVVLPRDATVGERVKLKGKIKVGKNFFCNDDVQIWGDDDRGVFIGDNVRVYTKALIDSGNHHSGDLNNFSTVGKRVVIKDFAVVDNSAIVCKGVTVGVGAIVTPGAVVLEDVPDNAVVEGNPAKVVGFRKYCYPIADT